MTSMKMEHIMEKNEIRIRLVDDENNMELVEKFLPAISPASATITKNDILNYNILRFKEAIAKYGETADYALLFSSRGAVKLSHIPLNKARNLLACMAADYYFACGVIKLVRGESHE